MATENKGGLFAFGTVLDVEDKIKSGNGEIWGRTIWLRCGSGEPLGFEVFKKQFSEMRMPENGSQVRINYRDTVDEFNGNYSLKRVVKTKGIEILNKIETSTPDKKVSNLKV